MVFVKINRYLKTIVDFCAPVEKAGISENRQYFAAEDKVLKNYFNEESLISSMGFTIELPIDLLKQPLESNILTAQVE